MSLVTSVYSVEHRSRKFTAVLRQLLIIRWFKAAIHLILSAALLQVSPAHATTQKTQVIQAIPQTQQAWSFSATLEIDPLNISGLVVTDHFMALATDEGHQIQLFKPLNSNIGEKKTERNAHKIWQPDQLISLDSSAEALRTELDIEGLTWQAPYLYAIGSHSVKRAKLKSKHSEQKSLKRLPTVTREPARHQLFRIQLDAEHKVVAVEALSLANLLQAHETLGLFTAIPSKENGVDIEGLTIDAKGRLLVGFRGPVLRGNIAIVLQLTLAKKAFKVKSVKTRHLPLEGRGVRGLSRITSMDPKSIGVDGSPRFLVLAGAVGDQPLSYQVYSWNGETVLFEKQVDQLGAIKPKPSAVSLHHLCDLPVTLGKPEGIAFLQQTATEIEFVVVQDGVKNGQPTVFRCPFN